MKASHPSSSAVDQRLEDLRSLLFLSQSLLEARGPPLAAVAFAARGLQIEGRLGARSLATLGEMGSPLLTETSRDDLAVFASAAGKIHHVGREFDLVLPSGRPEQAKPTRAILVGVRHEGRAIDQLPAGAEMICLLRFPQGAPPLVEALPLLDERSGVPALSLGLWSDYERLRR